jgi:hypothetical protein
MRLLNGSKLYQTNVAMKRRKQAAHKIDNIMGMSSILRPRKR